MQSKQLRPGIDQAYARLRERLAAIQPPPERIDQNTLAIFLSTSPENGGPKASDRNEISRLLNAGKVAEARAYARALGWTPAKR